MIIINASLFMTLLSTALETSWLPIIFEPNDIVGGGVWDLIENGRHLLKQYSEGFWGGGEWGTWSKIIIG